MLARRMLLFFALLVTVTAFSAALAPQRRPAPVPAPAPATPRPARSETVQRVLDAGRGRPRTITVHSGDLLRLTVRAPTADAVELQGLATLRPVAPETPVVFDVLADAEGEYPVVLLGADRTVGTVRVITQAE